VTESNEEEVWQAKIREHLVRSAALKCETAAVASKSILEAAHLISECYRLQKKVLICGNGGSAADAQHMAAEFMNRLRPDIERPGLPAIALTTDTSFLTSYANDFGYAGVFERQVLALGSSNDVLIGISTSGNSENVLRAVEAARGKDIRTVGLSGEGGKLASAVECAVVVPGRDTQHVQETLLALEHIICALVEELMFM